MKKFNGLLSLYLGVFSLFVSTLTYGAIIISPQNLPVAAPAYTHIPRQWQVASVYGPRDPEGAGSMLHKGIDYSQAAGNADKGIIIKAKLAGTINIIETGATARYISILSRAGNLTYIHIFDDRPLPVVISNKNARGYTKVVLANVARNKPTLKVTTCGAIFFYKNKLLKGKLVEKLDKLLTPAACSLAGKPYNIIAQTKVSAEEDIAPMGTSLPPNGIAAHLHLQLNAGADSLLTIMKHDFGLIPGTPKTKQFEIKLEYKDFTSDIMRNMIDGLGFAIQVKENSLVPVLDAVNVSFEGTNLKIFRFGGNGARSPLNVDNIKPAFLLQRGGVKATIKPIAWKNSAKQDGSGTPRIMYFFVPYPNMKSRVGQNTLNVTIYTVTGASFLYPLKFTIKSFCAAPPIKVGNLLVQSCDYVDTHRAGILWRDAKSVAQTYGLGWHLPTIDELNVLYLNKGVVGGFANTFYFSSTEGINMTPWIINFATGDQSTGWSMPPYQGVRAVRTGNYSAL
jgi:hypothetical protein